MIGPALMHRLHLKHPKEGKKPNHVFGVRFWVISVTIPFLFFVSWINNFSVLLLFVQKMISVEEETAPYYKSYDGLFLPIETKNILCGTGVPNISLSNTLLELGRDEILGFLDQKNTSHVRRKSKGNFEFPTKEFFWGLYLQHSQIVYRDKDNPNLFIMYVRVWKAANNQITGMEYQAGMTSSPFRENRSKEEIDFELFLQSYNATSQLPKICLYTAIRDPISHFLSGYNEIEFRRHSNSPPNVAHKLNTTDLFEQFVVDLFLNHLDFRKWEYLHIMPMSRILGGLFDYNLTLTDYIPSLTNLTKVWPEFIQKTCPGISPSIKFPKEGMRIGGQHESSEDPWGSYQAAKSVWKEQGHIARALCILHAFDYACYDKLSTSIPPLCVDVYRSSQFVDAVTGIGI
jgi:hypothetical protein